MKTALTLVASATLALLSACGGDGGGDSGTAQPSGTSPVAITSANQQGVARATVAGSFTVAQAQTADAGGRTGAQSASRVFAPAGAGAADRVVRRALTTMILQRRGAAAARARIAATTSTDNCAVSGTVTSAFADNDNSGTLSAGDVVTATFTQCRDSSSSLLNGTVAVTVTSVASEEQFSGTAVFQNVTSTQGALSTLINGNAAIAETDTDTESDDTITVGAGGLTVVATSTTYNDTIVYASGMTIASTETQSPAQTTLAVTGSFSADSISGSVTLATLQPVVVADDAEFPSAGEIKVTGANGSTLLLTAINATQVELQLDANGDGTVDSTVVDNWTDLLPQ